MSCHIKTRAWFIKADMTIFTNANEGGQKAFELLKDCLAQGKKTFGLATGGTPETLYQEMVKSDLDFSDCVSVNLDEYVGLGYLFN